MAEGFLSASAFLVIMIKLRTDHTTLIATRPASTGRQRDEPFRFLRWHALAIRSGVQQVGPITMDN